LKGGGSLGMLVAISIKSTGIFQSLARIIRLGDALGLADVA
jgi:hypothetical protein